MSILLTGGTGSTSRELINSLKVNKVPFLIASRRGAAAATSPDMKKIMVKFDFSDETTWATPFEQKIKAVYIVMVPSGDPVADTKKFIDFAQSQGVSRFVLLGESNAVKGGPFVGQIWQYLSDLKLEYSVLMPCWFIDNLARDEFALRPYIQKENKIYSATKNAPIPFVTVKDIGEVAYHALTDEKLMDETLYVFGPEELTYSDIAEKVSKALGRKIEYEEVDVETRKKQYEESGSAPSEVMVYLESESATFPHTPNDVVQRLCGRPGITVDEWLAEFGHLLS